MFHLAFPIRDVGQTKEFYTTILGAKIGRHSDTWIDFDLYGHQITAQLDSHFEPKKVKYNAQGVPSEHFGIILTLTEWKKLADQLEAQGVPFLIRPNVVFPGEIGEQHSFFISDPNGYAIEFKGFANLSDLFRSK